MILYTHLQISDKLIRFIFWVRNWSHNATHLNCSCSSCVFCWGSGRPSTKAPSFQIGSGWIWQHCSPSTVIIYASIDGNEFLIWSHSFKMAAGCHDFIWRPPAVRFCICSSVLRLSARACVWRAVLVHSISIHHYLFYAVKFNTSSPLSLFLTSLIIPWASSVMNFIIIIINICLLRLTALSSSVYVQNRRQLNILLLLKFRCSPPTLFEDGTRRQMASARIRPLYKLTVITYLN